VAKKVSALVAVAGYVAWLWRKSAALRREKNGENKY
jgi:hypothetical protein